MFLIRSAGPEQQWVDIDFDDHAKQVLTGFYADRVIQDVAREGGVIVGIDTIPGGNVTVLTQGVYFVQKGSPDMVMSVQTDDPNPRANILHHGSRYGDSGEDLLGRIMADPIPQLKVVHAKSA